jgi:hypothetical protein
MNGIIEGSLAVSGLFAAFLLSYWTLKAFEPKEALARVTVEHTRYKKAA